MKFNELESVKTLKDFPEEGVKKGDTGTIVMAFTLPNEAYEVEFVNSNGTTRAMFAILPEDLDQA
ncbi:MAG: DUF4926 domain-containing protein [Betaproteobacteria bacterium]|nr:DUF4926 domain-containing protein [Betaproteobacteria bacterium]